MQRMTKTSIANLKACDTVGFHEIGNAQDFSDYAENNHEDTCTYITSPTVIVWVERAGNRAYLCGSSGSPLIYDSAEKARRNIKRVRPDLEPTTI